jgi:hypothetical protein
MNPTSSEQEIIEKDQQQHPECNYSVAFSRVCSSQGNNSSVCETTRNLQRFCPGQRPITIYKKTEKSCDEDGLNDDVRLPGMLFRKFFEDDRSHAFNHSFSFGLPFGNKEGDEEFNFFSDPFRMMEDALNQYAKDWPKAFPDDGKIPSYRIPPHKAPSEGMDGYGMKRNAKPFGEIKGPVEEI